MTRPPSWLSLACSSDQKKRLRCQKAWMMLGSLRRLKFTSGTLITGAAVSPAVTR